MRWLVSAIYRTRPQPAPMAAHPAGPGGMGGTSRRASRWRR